MPLKIYLRNGKVIISPAAIKAPHFKTKSKPFRTSEEEFIFLRDASSKFHNFVVLQFSRDSSHGCFCYFYTDPFETTSAFLVSNIIYVGWFGKSEKNAIIEIFVSLLRAYSCIYTMHLLNNEPAV